MSPTYIFMLKNHDIVGPTKQYLLLLSEPYNMYYCFLITMASWRVRLRIKSPALRLFTQSFIQETDQRKHQGSTSLAFYGEFTGQGDLSIIVRGKFRYQIDEISKSISGIKTIGNISDM